MHCGPYNELLKGAQQSVYPNVQVLYKTVGAIKTIIDPRRTNKYSDSDSIP